MYDTYQRPSNPIDYKQDMDLVFDLLMFVYNKFDTVQTCFYRIFHK